MNDQDLYKVACELIGNNNNVLEIRLDLDAAVVTLCRLEPTAKPEPLTGAGDPYFGAGAYTAKREAAVTRDQVERGQVHRAATAGTEAIGASSGFGSTTNACAYGATYANQTAPADPVRLVGGAHFELNEFVPEVNGQIERLQRNRERLTLAVKTLKDFLQPVLVNQPENIPRAGDYNPPISSASRIGGDLETLANQIEAEARIVEALAACLAFK